MTETKTAKLPKKTKSERGEREGVIRKSVAVWELRKKEKPNLKKLKKRKNKKKKKNSEAS